MKGYLEKKEQEKRPSKGLRHDFALTITGGQKERDPESLNDREEKGGRDRFEGKSCSAYQLIEKTVKISVVRQGYREPKRAD